MVKVETPEVELQNLVDESYDFIRRYVLRLLHRARINDADAETEAEDLTQDVFLQARRAIDQFQGRSSLRNWVVRIAINLTKNRVDQLSRPAHRRCISLDEPADADDSETSPRLDFIPGSELLQPERVVENEELRSHLEEFSFKLHNRSEKYWQAFVLRDIRGLNYREAAEIVGCTEKCFRSRLFRARVFLRKHLERYLNDDP